MKTLFDLFLFFIIFLWHNREEEKNENLIVKSIMTRKPLSNCTTIFKAEKIKQE